MGKIEIASVVLDPKSVLHRFAVREEMLQLLCNAPRGDAIGAALAFLLHAADTDPGQLRAVLNSTVDRPGQPPTRIVDALTRRAR